jgi:serine phosphatase RsbU (regulator of sigma subunit)
LSTVQDVARAALRSNALRALVALARQGGWDLGLYDASGALLAPSDGDLDPTLDAGGSALVRAPVEALGDTVAHVAARSLQGPCDDGQALVEHAAHVLGDLCRQEIEIVDLAREIASAYEELNLFYDLTTVVAGARGPVEVCSAVLERALRVAPSRAARIVLRNERGELRTAVSRGDRGPVAIVGEPSAAAHCVASGEGFLLDSERAPHDVLLDGWESATEQALVVVPVRVLSGDDVQVIGALQLRDRLDGDGGRLAPYTSGDVKLAQALADQAALLIENSRLAAYERELQLACQIQQALLPSEPPRVEGLDVAAACLPAHDVGGDYYDFLTLEDEELLLVVADVSGHHLAAALLQTAARATFRAAALRGEGPARTLEIGNQALMDDLGRSDHFLTAWIARIDAFEGALVFEGAGHPAALLWRAGSGCIEELEGGGLPVGVLHHGGYRDRSARLEEGDILLVHTDGILEARDEAGEQFGEERVRAVLAEAADLSANDIVRRLLASVEAHAPRAADDRTLVVLKRAPLDAR